MLVFGLNLLFCHGMIGMLVYPLPGFSLVFLCIVISIYDMILDSWFVSNKSIKLIQVIVRKVYPRDS